MERQCDEEDEPQPSRSRQESEPGPVTYWLAQYFTRVDGGGLCVTGLRYSHRWPKEKVEKTAKEVQAGDKFAVRDLPVVVKQVTSSSSPPPPTEKSKHWSVKYRVFESPTSMNQRTVRLNYSGVFTEDQVRADALRAVGFHKDAVPDTLVIEQRDPDSSSSSNDSYDEALNVDRPYPLLKDKGWLKKMTQSEEGTAKSPSKRRGLAVSSPSPEKRRSLRQAGKDIDPSPTEVQPDPGDSEPQPSTSKASQPDPGDSEPQPSTSKASQPDPGDSEPTTVGDEEVQPEQQDARTSSRTEERSSPPVSSTSKKSKPLLTPKERFKGQVFQHPCTQCGKAYPTRQLMKTHISECVHCPHCGKWRDPRHVELCKDKVLCEVCDLRRPANHKCGGKKVVKGKRILCPYCQRDFSEGHMWSHMKAIHGVAYSKGGLPLCLPVEKLKEQQQLAAKSEADKKELEQLRSGRAAEMSELDQMRAQRDEEKKQLDAMRAEREEERRLIDQMRAEREQQSEEYEREVQRLRAERAEAVKKAEADRVQLEQEVHRIKQEKLAMEGMKLAAEKAIRERDDELQKVADLLKAKQDEIRQKEYELKAMYDAAAEKDPTEQPTASSSGRDSEVQVRAEPEDPLDDVEQLSDEERDARGDDTFWFPLPEKFSEAKGAKPTDMELFEMIQLAPDYVRRGIMTFMPESVRTASPKLAYEYSRSGRLPNWIVIWFMRAVRVIDKKSSDEMLYIKAMHLIEALREMMIQDEENMYVDF